MRLSILALSFLWSIACEVTPMPVVDTTEVSSAITTGSVTEDTATDVASSTTTCLTTWCGTTDTGVAVETGSSTSVVTTGATDTGFVDTEQTAIAPTVTIITPEESWEGDVGVSHTFEAETVLGAEASMVQYEWDFGDGSVFSTYSDTITHTYASPGIYDVTMTASQFDGSDAACDTDGVCAVTIVTNYTPCTSGDDEDCMGRVTIGGDKKIQYWRNYALGTENDAITKVVIIQHGNGRTADSYFGSAIAAATTEGVLHSTLILAPRFQTVGDDPAEDELYWESRDWKWGYPSEDGTNTISYDVMDELFEKIGDPGKFPNLEEIVFYGHSAGGQFVSRYVAGSEAADLATLLGVNIRFVVANPSSVVYLDNHRAVSGTTDTFEVPFALFTCPEYNVYGYGLDFLSTYMFRSTLSEIRNRYEDRHITFMVGTDDTDDHDLDTDCEAMLQGQHRLERMEIFFNYLQTYYDTSRKDLLYVKGVGHTNYGMLTSPEGRELIFSK
jgi:PKD repeat protein